MTKEEQIMTDQEQYHQNLMSNTKYLIRDVWDTYELRVLKEFIDDILESKKWKCDGCGNMFDETEINDSYQLPYYTCQDCEESLKKEWEEKWE